MASQFFKYSVFLQKYRTPLLATGCAGVFAANLCYHVFPDMTFRPLYQAWFKKEPVTLSENLEDVFQQVVFCSLLSFLTARLILIAFFASTSHISLFFSSFAGVEGLWCQLTQ